MSDPDLAVQVVMNAGEVDFVASKFVQALGRVWDSADFQQLAEIIHHFKFTIFLAFLETRYTQDMETEALREAIDDVYDVVVEDVVKKGPLQRRADCLRLPLSPQTQVVNLIEQSGVRPNRFSVSADGAALELAAPDYKTKFQWLSALETAVSFSGSPQGCQRHLAAARRAEWHQTEARQHEDDRRRLSQINIMDSTKAELEKAEEERKLAELEETRLELERLLQEEKQAKRDEELVRSAQSRVLRQEWEKREDLERLQRQKREAFEVLQKSKQRQLEEAQLRLREVEEGRVKLDRELKAARCKLITAERTKGQVESKLRVREREVSLRQSAVPPGE
ncbi:differentially expressed in FDCP 6 homolog, partial [Pollicipes pollicipes]|uniref:differentially expressed in FDCP 6 homolog n=1 Tax=Pollicipes pollicipes TaxID=41117 RepID=UPI001884C7D5